MPETLRSSQDSPKLWRDWRTVQCPERDILIRSLPEPSSMVANTCRMSGETDSLDYTGASLVIRVLVTDKAQAGLRRLSSSAFFFS